jgi:hypothetical protein
MTLLEEITKQSSALPPEQQTEVLNFIATLQQQRVDVPQCTKPDSLRGHSAFGSWKKRKVDAVKYQQDLRDEWDTQ